MKNLVGAITFGIIFAVLIVACSKQSKTDNSMRELQPKENFAKVSDVQEIVRGRVIVDTAIGHWTIKTTIDSNEVIIGQNDMAENDSSVFLSLSYDNKIIYSGKEIRTKDVVGSEGVYLMNFGGEVFWVSDSAIYLSFGCFKPDSDVGWDILFQILPDGKSNSSFIDYTMGVDGECYIANFMALYLNERAVGASAADLKRIYEYYCDKELTKNLCTATIPIVANNTDFRYADRTLEINSLDSLIGSPLAKYSFEVKFKPNPKDNNVTDILHMEVDGATNKISKIEPIARNMKF